MGTVIDEAAAIDFEQRVDAAVAGAPGFWPATSGGRAVFADGPRRRSADDEGREARDLRTGITGHPFRVIDEAIAIAN